MLSCLIFFSGGLLFVGIPFWSFFGSLIIMWEVSLGYLPSGFFLSISLDPWSISFGMVMCFVASHVYWYSLSYMSNCSGNSYFYFPLSVFVFSMILLIFSLDFLCLFLAWDGLGVSSFMLVFFYNSSQSAGGSLITALTNRFGDFCFFLGISFQLCDFDFLSCFGSSGIQSVMFLLAAFSKSAQWPLSAWLPAAMAAPTPVSSLVHSSTLVTAGVYLLFRVESYVGFYSSVLSYISLLTFFLASLSASLSYDLKRVVAMSTLGHLALMIMALGMCEFSLGFFHLLTHALFKSLLFMGSGNAISSFFHSQDLRDMGGMGELMPVTGQSIVISLISLSGVPFSSGFYSKDLILELVCSGGGKDYFMLSLIPLVSLALSMVYCSRVFFYLFLGSSNWSVGVSVESSSYLISPLISLSAVSIIFGSLGDWVIYPRELSLGYSASSLIVWMIIGIFSALFMVWFSLMGAKDWVGFNNLCYIRAPCQILCHEVMMYSLNYLKEVEQGWGEEVGPRGLNKACVLFSGKSSRFEW